MTKDGYAQRASELTALIEALVDDAANLLRDADHIEDMTAHAAHVLEVLAAHRMTVVTLPEPDSTSGKAGKGSIWVTPVEDVRTTVFGEVVVGASWWVQPYAARKFAAALLAAADAAEVER